MRGNNRIDLEVESQIIFGRKGAEEDEKAQRNTRLFVDLMRFVGAFALKNNRQTITIVGEIYVFEIDRLVWRVALR
jgi:hypothetical protein